MSDPQNRSLIAPTQTGKSEKSLTAAEQLAASREAAEQSWKGAAEIALAAQKLKHAGEGGTSARSAAGSEKSGIPEISTGIVKRVAPSGGGAQRERVRPVSRRIFPTFLLLRCYFSLQGVLRQARFGVTCFQSCQRVRTSRSLYT